MAYNKMPIRSVRINGFRKVLSACSLNARTKFSRVRAAVRYFREQPESLRRYVLYARKLGVMEAFRHAAAFVIRGGPRQTPFSPAIQRKLLLCSSSERPTVILTTFHCLYVAHAISAALSRVGINSKIIHECPTHGYSDDPYFVICPQMFAQLPRFYIALQMEQSGSSPWFADGYLSILENSIAILDYSTINIDFLRLKGLSLRKIFHLPIGYLSHYDSEPESTEEDYDVIFYGAENTRRKNFLRELKKHCRVKVINNLFGADLRSLLARARIVVNIHYYPDALLETTRIWECLSLHKLVVSERSCDMEHHDNLAQLIDFVDIDNVSSMIERVRYWLDNDNLRRQRISENRLLLERQTNQFDYFFYRFLLATDNITFDDFWHQIGHRVELPSDTVCLTLPEYVERTAEFNKDNRFGFSCFQGLRHTQSWLGCAMSYKYIIMLARQQCLPQLTVCEDDVKFPADFATQWQDIRNHLNDRNLNWDIFSGLMADLNKNANIIGAHIHRNHQFVTIDKFISMVFNVYNQCIFDTIARWDETNHDVTTNTIDRYLENHGAIKVLTTTPFLVGHKESQESTLWGIKNGEYSDPILASGRLLREKVRTYNGDTTPS